MRIEGAEWVEEGEALMVDFISETAASRPSLWTSARKMEARRAKSVFAVYEGDAGGGAGGYEIACQGCHCEGLGSLNLWESK